MQKIHTEGDPVSCLQLQLLSVKGEEKDNLQLVIFSSLLLPASTGANC